MDVLWLGEGMASFYYALLADDRLRPQHVCLYLAILWMGKDAVTSGTVTISRKELMQISRLTSKATYHHCIRDLERFGYIRYMPTYNSYLGSKVVLLL